MKKIYYIANIRLPTDRAHGIQIMKMCEAFAEHAQVELVVTDRAVKIAEDSFSYYRVRRNFTIRKLWSLNATRFGAIGFHIGALSFALSVFPYAVRRGGVFYTRDAFMAFFLKLCGKKVFWEIHMRHNKVLARLIMKMGVPVITISHGLKNLYPFSHRVYVAPDGVDLEQFSVLSSRKEARQRLGLDLEQKLVVYAGSKQPWKGVETLERAAELLEPDIRVLIVVGKPQAEIPTYLRAADVVVIPNSAKEEISRTLTSPLKLFEYMASGTPIVASDLPSLREIVDESMVAFFTPNDPVSLAHSVREVFTHLEVARKKGVLAQEMVQNYSWDKRAEKIISFISS